LTNVKLPAGRLENFHERQDCYRQGGKGQPGGPGEWLYPENTVQPGNERRCELNHLRSKDSKQQQPIPLQRNRKC
jgi:hypothetical protein